MLRWAFIFLIVAIVAGILGFTDVEFVSATIARVLFGIKDSRMVLLHAFIKKTQKTPQGDLDLALKRMKEIT